MHSGLYCPILGLERGRISCCLSMEPGILCRPGKNSTNELYPSAQWAFVLVFVYLRWWLFRKGLNNLCRLSWLPFHCVMWLSVVVYCVSWLLLCKGRVWGDPAEVWPVSWATSLHTCIFPCLMISSVPGSPLQKRFHFYLFTWWLQEDIEQEFMSSQSCIFHACKAIWMLLPRSASAQNGAWPLGPDRAVCAKAIAFEQGTP